jgi:hypothetical protein
MRKAFLFQSRRGSRGEARIASRNAPGLFILEFLEHREGPLITFSATPAET